jgi:RNA polymerase sigma-70 factor (ECF subfamily)
VAASFSDPGFALLPDAALVALARGEDAAQPDERAFAVLYDRHVRYVSTVVFRLLGSDGDIDDVVQETFLDARGILAQLNDPGAVRGWLVTIAVRRVHRLLRKRRRRAFLAACLAEFSAKASNPRDREPVDELYEALDRLPPDLRLPWALARIEQLGLDEIARACDVSLATVKRRIALAEERLRRRLEV